MGRRHAVMGADGQPDALATIALNFGIGAAIGDQAEDGALAVAGMPRRIPQQPVFPFPLAPAPLVGTSVGSFLDSPDNFGPGTGWFWDIISISAAGFTAGAITVTKNAPAVTAAGNPVAIEQVGVLTVAAPNLYFPASGFPLIDCNERLVFTVTSAITGLVTISGSAIMVPASRIDDYLS